MRRAPRWFSPVGATSATSLSVVAFTTAEGRTELLGELGEAADELAEALEILTSAYEALDDATAETLEGELFRPVQRAYGRAKRTHAEFAGRHQLPKRAFGPNVVKPAASRGPKELIETAVDKAAQADHLLAELQDTMLPAEVGDPELRAGLSEVRGLISDFPLRARQILMRLGR